MAGPAPELFDLVMGRPFTASTPDLLASAVEHRLSGLLLDVAESGDISLPQNEMKELTMADMVMVSRHQQLWRSLSSAMSALAGRGFMVYSIKGVAEEARWYDRVGQRPCGDVDLVVMPNDLARIDEIMQVLCPQHGELDDIIELVANRQLQHVDIAWDETSLDLHFDPLKLGIWIRQGDLVTSTATTVAGPNNEVVPVLAPELALVSFLTHLNKDRFSYLGPYGDVARIATRPDLDWDLVTRFVEGEGIEVPVWKSLAVVAETLELDLPVPSVTGWRSRIWDGLWPESSRLLGHEGRTSRRQAQAWIPLLTTGRWPEVLREGHRRLMPPRALLDLHLPELRDHSFARRLTTDRLPWSRTSGTPRDS